MTKGGAIEELWTAPTFWVRGVRVDWPFTGIAIEVLQSCGGVSTYACVYLSCFTRSHSSHRASSTYD